MATLSAQPYDVTSQMGSIQPLISADLGDVPAGPTVTTENDDVLYGTSTKVQRWNAVTAASWSKSFGTPLDLTGRSVALIANIVAPELTGYYTGALTADFRVGTDSTFTLTSDTFVVLSSATVRIELQPGVRVDGTWNNATKTFTVTSVRSGAGTTVLSGTRVYTSPGLSDTSLPLVVWFALSSADAAANRYEWKINGAWNGWNTFILPLGDCDPTLGPEVRSVGSPVSDLITRVGYIKINALPTQTLPANVAGINDYRGPQGSINQYTVKWNAFVSFVRTKRRRVAFSFDDGTSTHWSIVAQEFEKPRPNSPNGVGRITANVIFENIQNGDTDSQYLTRANIQRMAQNGHEIGLHADRTYDHQAESTGGDGPLNRQESRVAGRALQSIVDELNNIRSHGIRQPYISHAMPLSCTTCYPHPSLPALGVVCSRSLSNGSVLAVVTNPGRNDAACTGFTKQTGFTRRFISWPVGNPTGLPSQLTDDNMGTVTTGAGTTYTAGSNQVTGTTGLSSAHVGSTIYKNGNIPLGARIRSVVGTTVTMEFPDGTNANATASGAGAASVGDKRGHFIEMRAILEACKQGMAYSIHSHQQTEDMGASIGFGSDSSRWSRSMWRTVLDYIDDLKGGTNNFGNNAALDHYSDLKVVTLQELVTDIPQQKVHIERAGLGV